MELESVELILFKDLSQEQKIAQEGDEILPIEQNEFEYLKEGLLQDSDLSKREKEQIQKIKDLNQKLDQNPQNESLWIQYLKLQEERDKNKKVQVNSSAQRKLAIVEKALSYQGNKSSSVLNMLRIEFKSQLQESDHQQLQMWKQLLREANSPQLQILILLQFFLFIQRSRTLELDTIRLLMEQVCSNYSHLKELGIEFYLEILQKFGYIEQALSILIANCEVNYFRPLTFIVQQSSDKQILSFYEKFCSEEAPKLGEIRAFNGFFDWLQLRKNEMRQDLFAEQAQLDQDSSRIKQDQNVRKIPYGDDLKPQEFQQFLAEWAGIEKKTQYLMPLKTKYNSKQIENCPEGLVLFEDFSTFIQVSPVYHITDRWIRKLLAFLGLQAIDEAEIKTGSSCIMEKIIAKQSDNFMRSIELNRSRLLFFKWPDCLIFKPKIAQSKQYSRILQNVLSHLKIFDAANPEWISLSIELDFQEMGEFNQEKVKRVRKHLKDCQNLEPWLLFVKNLAVYDKQQSLKVLNKVYSLFTDSLERLLIIDLELSILIFHRASFEQFREMIKRVPVIFNEQNIGAPMDSIEVKRIQNMLQKQMAELILAKQLNEEENLPPLMRRKAISPLTTVSRLYILATLISEGITGALGKISEIQPSISDIVKRTSSIGINFSLQLTLLLEYAWDKFKFERKAIKSLSYEILKQNTSSSLLIYSHFAFFERNGLERESKINHIIQLFQNPYQVSIIKSCVNCLTSSNPLTLARKVSQIVSKDNSVGGFEGNIQKWKRITNIQKIYFQNLLLSNLRHELSLNEGSLTHFIQKFLIAVTKYPNSRLFYVEMIQSSMEVLSQIEVHESSGEKILKSLKNIVDLFIVKGFRSMLEFS